MSCLLPDSEGQKVPRKRKLRHYEQSFGQRGQQHSHRSQRRGRRQVPPVPQQLTPRLQDEFGRHRVLQMSGL
jgi:hypothetical protein